MARLNRLNTSRMPSIDPRPPKRDPLLQPDVDAVHGIADEAVARHDRAVRAEARERLESLAEAAQVFAVDWSTCRSPDP